MDLADEYPEIGAAVRDMVVQVYRGDATALLSVEQAPREPYSKGNRSAWVFPQPERQHVDLVLSHP
jgi:hypothetical protein